MFLTNRSELDALTICSLYKSRWQVELFFKWLKQHLRVKRFLGVSENAVKSQLWIAVSVYVLVAILRKRLAIDTPALHNAADPLGHALRANASIPSTYCRGIQLPTDPAH